MQFSLRIVAKSEYGTVDDVDKTVQVVLLLVLIYFYLNTPSESAENTPTAAD